jgi:alpha-aminoadipate carrier protein LysW
MIRPLEGRGEMVACPECEADIEIDEYDVDKGEIISCPECGVELEVVGLSPLELDVAPPQEDDEWEE